MHSRVDLVEVSRELRIRFHGIRNIIIDVPCRQQAHDYIDATSTNVFNDYLRYKLHTVYFIHKHVPFPLTEEVLNTLSRLTKLALSMRSDAASVRVNFTKICVTVIPAKLG